MFDLALLAPNSSNLQPWTFYVVQNPAKKKQLVKACLGQLAAKTASELIVCVARTDRVDEMAKKNISEFPFPEAPAMVKNIIVSFRITIKLVISMHSVTLKSCL
jgi:nitroreductase